MSIYETLLENIENGKGFKIDLKKKSLRIGSKFYVKEREVLTDEDLIDEEGSWERVSELYQQFKYSVPSKTDRNGYFTGLTADELTDSELAFNVSRRYAQAALEGYILLSSLKGVLQWKNDEHWFWQDSTDKECIVLKEWI